MHYRYTVWRINNISFYAKIFDLLTSRKLHGSLLFLNLIFTYFSMINNSGKVFPGNFRKFRQQDFVVTYQLKIRYWMSQFSKPDDIGTYNIIKHLKFHTKYYRAFYFHATSRFMCLRNDKFRALTKYKLSIRCALL